MIQHWLTQYCFCDSTGSLEGVERLLRVSCQLWPRMPHLSLPARLGSYWVSFRCAPLGQNKGAWGLASLSQGGRPKLCHYHRAKAWVPSTAQLAFLPPTQEPTGLTVQPLLEILMGQTEYIGTPSRICLFIC